MSLERALAQLVGALPSGPDLDPAQQARAVLRLLDCQPVPATPIAAHPTVCPNCGADCPSTRSPYCSADCREEASFVRQFRAGLQEDWIQDHEKQVALGQNLWRLLGGGYPYRQTLILDRSKTRALARSSGNCETCGQPATTFDHITTACNRDINLRPVCYACTRTKPFSNEAFIAASALRIQALAARVVAPLPLRASDDPGTWDWRSFLMARKQAT